MTELNGFFRALDAELLHPATQSAGIQVQDSSRAAFALDHPICLIQHRLNVPPLDLFQSSGAIWSCRGWDDQVLIFSDT